MGAPYSPTMRPTGVPIPMSAPPIPPQAMAALYQAALNGAGDGGGGMGLRGGFKRGGVVRRKGGGDIEPEESRNYGDPRVMKKDRFLGLNSEAIGNKSEMGRQMQYDLWNSRSESGIPKGKQRGGYISGVGTKENLNKWANYAKKASGGSIMPSKMNEDMDDGQGSGEGRLEQAKSVKRHRS